MADQSSAGDSDAASSAASRQSEPFVLSFESQVSHAIELALGEQRPLLMLLRDTTQNSEQWCAERFGLRSRLSAITRRLLAEQVVRLQLWKDSTDFGFFLQLFPQFATLVLPAVVLIYRGQIVDLITGETSVEEFDRRIAVVVGDAGAISTTAATPTPPPQTVEAPPPAAQIVESPPPVAASPPPTATPLPPAATPPPPAAASPPPAAVHKTLKQESAEYASQKYRENLLKQQKEAELNKKRILRLMQLDREEKRLEAQLRHKKSEQDSTKRPTKQAEQAEHSSAYVIQLKLFDGETLRLNLASTDTLATIRENVLEMFKEYQQLPFHFFKTVDRITYSTEDEQQTLSELQLDRCTLILKPIDPFEQQQEPEEKHGSSTFQWLREKIGSLWGAGSGAGVAVEANATELGGSEGGEELHSEHDEQMAAHATTASSPVPESESDSETVYHSPDLRSLVSRSSSPFEPSLNLTSSNSNFDLHGTNAAPFIQGAGRPGTPKTTSSSRFRAVEGLDRREVYNGNNVNLEDDER